MKKNEDKNTRYYLDLDLKEKKILNWDFDQKDNISQKLENPYHQRVFISKGQFTKLKKGL